MRVAFHGATTMTSDLETDVRVTAYAGFKALELWATKVDKYLQTHSVDELKALLANTNVAPMTFNSIEFIAFRGASLTTESHSAGILDGMSTSAVAVPLRIWP